MDNNNSKRPRPGRVPKTASSGQIQPTSENGIPNKVGEPSGQMPIQSHMPVKASEVKKAPEVKKTPEVKKASEVKKAPEVNKASEVKKAPEVKKTPEANKAHEIKKAPEVKKTPEVKKSRAESFDNIYTADDIESEKTRLTDALPRSGLKTPVGDEKKAATEGGSIMSGVLRAVVYMTAILIVAIVMAYAVIVSANDVFAFVKPEEAVEVIIPENTSSKELADILGESGVIKYPSLFKLYSMLKNETGIDKNGNSIFIPGTYLVSPMTNYMQLMTKFQKHNVRATVWVTFPEGATVEDMITVLTEEYGIASREEFISAINDYDYGFDFLEGLEAKEGRYYRLEGYLFPDTYQFYTNSSAETVIYRMLQNFKKKLSYIGEDNCNERLSELGMTLDEVVTLASMIEKEVKYAIDYENVASVFHNRLNDPANFQRLESDATTVYALWMATGTRPDSLTTADLDFDDPYNTRVSKGLPPGAIANPGYEALWCAFYPAKTNYYYFVADNNGYNRYARTYKVHQENIAEIMKEAKK